MTEDEVRHHAEEKLSELLLLNSLATSEGQRRDFKEAREYLTRAAKSGVETDFRVGLYWFAVISGHVRMVQDGKRKGEMRAQRRAKEGGDSA